MTRPAVARLTRLALIGVSLCLAILLLAKLGQLGGSIRPRDAAYYLGLPAVLSAAALYAACLRPAVRAVVCVHLLAVAAGVVSAEIYLALAAKPPSAIKRDQYVAKWVAHGIPHDPRPLLDVVRDMRRGNVDAYPGLSPITLLEARGGDHLTSAIRIDGREILPLATASNTVSVICNERADYLLYESDERGFRNPGNVWSLDGFDVGAIGDSFTNGYCVPSDASSVALIRERYPATLNLGMGGNGPLIELATLTEYLTHVRPRIVLWFYYEGNDLLDLDVERRSQLLMRYLVDGFSQGLMAGQAAIDRSIRQYFDRGIAQQDLARHSVRLELRDVLLLRHLRGKLAQTLGVDSTAAPDEPAVLDLLRDVLATAKRRTEAWGGTFALVYLPSVWTRLPKSEQPWQTSMRERVLGAARALAIPVIDVSADFLAHPDPASLFAIPDMETHYNESGHRLVADRVLHRLSASAIVPETRKAHRGR